MVVQIAGVYHLGSPSIETRQPRLPIHFTVYVAAQAAVAVKNGQIALLPALVAVPHLRAAFQPALKIPASDYLLHELPRLCRRMRSERRRQRIGLQHQLAPDVG